MKYIQFAIFICLIILVGFSIFTPITFAAGLVPCGPGIAANPSCDVCDFFKMADNIIKFVMTYVVPAIAAILMVVGAITFMTAGGSEGQITKGKSIITSTVIGIVIILLAWIVVDSVIKSLTGNNKLLGKFWYNIECK